MSRKAWSPSSKSAGEASAPARALAGPVLLFVGYALHPDLPTEVDGRARDAGAGAPDGTGP